MTPEETKTLFKHLFKKEKYVEFTFGNNTVDASHIDTDFHIKSQNTVFKLDKLPIKFLNFPTCEFSLTAINLTTLENFPLTLETLDMNCLNLIDLKYLSKVSHEICLLPSIHVHILPILLTKTSFLSIGFGVNYYGKNKSPYGVKRPHNEEQFVSIIETNRSLILHDGKPAKLIILKCQKELIEAGFVKNAQF